MNVQWIENAEDRLTQDCEITQHFVDENRDQGLSVYESCMKAHYDLSRIRQMCQDLVLFDEYCEQVLSRRAGTVERHLLSVSILSTT